MDLVALGIFLLAFLICSLLVFFISVYGTKEVSFEENLKASHGDGKKGKNHGQDAKKKAKKVAKITANSDNENQQQKIQEEVQRSETPIEDAPADPEPPTLIPDESKTSSSSTEATPKKSKKKQKIKIEEIETIDEPLIEQEEVQQNTEQIIEPVKQPKPQIKKENKKKKEKNPRDDLILQPKTSMEDILGIVMKTPLDDLEIQNVIDLLLTKQTGSTTSNYHDWIDASENKNNETKNLQRQLAEKDALLADEEAKCKSITNKMNELRHELNSTRSTQVQNQRLVQELEALKRNAEMRLQAEVDQHQRYVQGLHNEIQYHSGRANNLQVTLDSIQQQQQATPQIDPALYQELESLRALKMSLEAECGSLHGKLGKQQEEQQQLQQKLTKKSHDLDEARTSLQKLSDKLTVAEKKNSSESGQYEELKRANQELEAKMKEMTSVCMNQKTELSRLADENDRISDQLASYVERPATEGQEANGNLNGDHHNSNDKKTEEVKDHQDNVWHKKYLAVSQEHEQILKEKDVIVQKMHSVESGYKTQVSKLEADLEDQRAKNNDTKNLESAIRDAEASQKQFLQRLFPGLKVQSDKHADWLDEFAKAAQKQMKDQSEKAKQTKTNNKPESDDKLQKLEGQVKHYKSVLAETENMLNELQASVESEESGWKLRLSDKESQLEKLQRQLEAVEAKNTAMEASINSLNSVEEMETKLRELQEKLAVEEADKLQLQNQLHRNLENEETPRLRNQVETEVRLRQELEEKIAKMNQLLSTGQEALQQEKKTVELLRQQISSQTPLKGSSLTTNGQEEPESSASSQVGSVASLDLDKSIPEKKKSKKKKLLGLFK